MRLAPAIQLTFLLALILPPALLAEPFDKGGINIEGARSLGLAGAVVAQAEDSSALWFNPAALEPQKGYELYYQYASVLGGQLLDNLVAHRGQLPELGIAYGLAYRRYLATASSGFTEQTTLLSGAIPFTEDHRLLFGASLKLYNTQLNNVAGGEAHGFGIDLGFLYRPPLPVEGLSLGLGAIDFQDRLDWATGLALNPPQLLQIGAAWRFDPLSVVEFDSEVVTDSIQSSRSSQGFRVGAERWFSIPKYSLNRLVALRFGYLQSSALAPSSLSGLFTVGAGLQFRGVSIDYAYLQDLSSLGETHRFSGSYQFEPFALPGGTASPTPKATPVAGKMSLTLRSEPPSFNPSKKQESARIALLATGDTAGVASTELAVVSAQGDTVLALKRDGFQESLRWDGNDASGKIASEGAYQIFVRLNDGSGQELASAETSLTVILSSAEMGMVLDSDIFAPGASSRRNSISLGFGKAPTGLQSYTVSIRHQGDKKVLRSFKGKVLPRSIRWDGKNQFGKVVPDGAYSIELKGLLQGGRSVVSSTQVEVDTRRPQLSVEAYPRIFEPGLETNAVGIDLKAEKMAGIPSRWELLVETLDGKRVRLFEGKGTPPERISWPGKDDQGQKVPNETLFYLSYLLEMESGAVAKAPRLTLGSEVTAFKEQSAIKVTLAVVHFNANEENISLEDYKALKEAADGVKKYGNEYLLQVLGHADGTEAATGPMSALELSYLRAKAVRDYLAEAGGLEADRIKAMGFGSERPQGDDATDDGRAKNRRVDVILFTK
jgi:outer membrane protein OmpA-like peptidoglycan-associated protein